MLQLASHALEKLDAPLLAHPEARAPVGLVEEKIDHGYTLREGARSSTKRGRQGAQQRHKVRGRAGNAWALLVCLCQAQRHASGKVRYAIRGCDGAADGASKV